MMQHALLLLLIIVLLLLFIIYNTTTTKKKHLNTSRIYSLDAICKLQFICGTRVKRYNKHNIYNNTFTTNWYSNDNGIVRAEPSSSGSNKIYLWIGVNARWRSAFKLSLCAAHAVIWTINLIWMLNMNWKNKQRQHHHSHHIRIFKFVCVCVCSFNQFLCVWDFSPQRFKNGQRDSSPTHTYHNLMVKKVCPHLENSYAFVRRYLTAALYHHHHHHWEIWPFYWLCVCIICHKAKVHYHHWC